MPVDQNLSQFRTYVCLIEEEDEHEKRKRQPLGILPRHFISAVILYNVPSHCLNKVCNSSREEEGKFQHRQPMK